MRRRCHPGCTRKCRNRYQITPSRRSLGHAPRKIYKITDFSLVFIAHVTANNDAPPPLNAFSTQKKPLQLPKQPDKFMLIFITSVFKFLAAACMCAIETHLSRWQTSDTLPLDEGASCHNPRPTHEGASTYTDTSASAFPNHQNTLVKIKTGPQILRFRHPLMCVVLMSTSQKWKQP